MSSSFECKQAYAAVHIYIGKLYSQQTILPALDIDTAHFKKCPSPSLLAHSFVAASSKSSSMALNSPGQLWSPVLHPNMILGRTHGVCSPFPVDGCPQQGNFSHATEPAPPHQPLQPSDLWPAKDAVTGSYLADGR